MSERPSQEKTTDTAIVLNFIDKVYEGFKRTDTMARRIESVGIVLALFLLALSTGAASTSGALAFGGFGIRVPLAVLLTGGAIFVGVITASTRYFEAQSWFLSQVILLLYQGIGYMGDGAVPPKILQWAPFYSPRLIAAVTLAPGNQLWANVSNWVVTITFPVAAMIATGFKVAQLLYVRGLGWVWVLFVLWAIASGVAHSYSYTQALKRATETPGVHLGHLGFAGFWRHLIRFTVFALPGAGLGYFVARVLGSA